MDEKAIRQNSFRARREGLLVHSLDDEVLVYDLERHKAHCLNRAAALVWEHCDGKTSVAEMTKMLACTLKTPADPGIVWLALNQLDKARLLEERIARPGKMAGAAVRGISRREVIKRVGLAAAISIPLISSVISPTPAEAVTCVKSGQTCTTSAQCCSKVCNTGVTPHKCV